MNRDENQIRAQFDQLMIEGGYQYSQSNRDNAYAWFRKGWLENDTLTHPTFEMVELTVNPDAVRTLQPGAPVKVRGQTMTFDRLDYRLNCGSSAYIKSYLDGRPVYVRTPSVNGYVGDAVMPDEVLIARLRSGDFVVS